MKQADPRPPDAELFEDRRLRALGRLAAGLAHELNTPLGYILSNLSVVEGYIHDLKRLARPGEDVDFLAEDAASAIRDSRQGAERIRELVRELQEFARGEDGSDLLRCLERALKVAWNELKYAAEVERDLRPLPPRPCAGMTQAFLELLLAAGEAVGKKGVLRLSSGVEGGCAVVRIRDTGGAVRPPVEEARRIVSGLGGRIELRPEGGEAAVLLPL